MKTFINSVLGGLLAAALVLPAQADDHTTLMYNDLQEELVVGGEVIKVMTGPQLVQIRTPHGAEVEVPLDTLGTLADRQEGYSEMVPGDKVDARMHPGVLGLAKSHSSHLWITVDGKKFVRVNAEELDDDLFDDDERTVRLDDGREVDVSVSEVLEDHARALNIMNW